MASDQSEEETIDRFLDQFRIDDPKSFRLADRDPGSTDGVRNKKAAAERLEQGVARLSDLQTRLAAQQTYGVILVLQALDAAGKDGAIRHVMTGLNPQGVRVVSFKSPSTEELAHHYLWRIDRDLPRRGEIGIFNRSHYEEVLAVRVHPEFLDAQHLPPSATKGIWTRRFREINDWERGLVASGFPIVKVFLHMSKDEQRRRLLSRIDEPAKNWKFSALDVKERQSWDEYQDVYEDAIRNTSTKTAPWYVVPADAKWFARLVIAEALAAALIDIDPQFPTLSDEARDALAEQRVQLEQS